MFKHIQSYLLKNHPLLWQSKFIPMMIIGIIGWVVAFLSGYEGVSMKVLQSERLSGYYSENFIVLHITSGLVIYVVWALYFFRTNPLFQYYPLRRNYLPILLFQIFLPVLVFSSLYFPYTYGAFLKTNSLLSEETLKADARVLSRAYPFLVAETDKYKIENRVYPSPFPLNSFHRAEGNQWNDIEAYYKPNIVNNRFDTLNSIYRPSETDSFTQVDEQPYLFFTSHQWTDETDTCAKKTYQIIDRFIQPSVKRGLHYYDVENFSTVLINPNSFPNSSYRYNEDRSSTVSSDDYYRDVIAPEIFSWIENKNTDSITSAIEAFSAVCTKYQIAHRIPTQRIVDSLLKHDFMPTEILTHLYSPRYAYGYSGEPEENTYDAYVDDSGITTLYSNFSQAHAYAFNDESLLVFVILSLSIALFFFIAYCIEFISILISIPVTGVIMISSGFILSEMHGSNAGLIFSFIIAVSFLILGFYALQRKDAGKRTTGIMLCLGFYSLPFVATIALAMVQEFTKIQVQECYGWTSQLRYHLNPWHVILLFLVLLVFYIPTLVRLRSKEE